VIQDPEVWLSASLQLTNYCLTHTSILTQNKVTRNCWVDIYNHCKQRAETFSYLLPTLDFCILKVGLKMLSLGLIDDALHIAFRLNNRQILSHAYVFANKQRNPILTNLIDYHMEKEDPNHQTTMAKAISQIANFSQKQLKKEDFNNLQKDFETLIKIDDISDLELADFNGWDINLEEYQKALDLEFQGNFQQAEEIYKRNGIKNDVLRVQNLQKELGKELRDGER
jgi:hypothetical protein